MSWTSSKDTIATVGFGGNAETAGQVVGNAKGTGAGKATIKVGGVVKGKNKSDSVKMTIKQQVTTLQMAKTTVNVAAGKKATLQVKKQLPKKCTAEIISWSLLNSKDEATAASWARLLPARATKANKSTKVTLNLKNASDIKAGDWAVFQAKAQNGATSTVMVIVSNKTTKVAVDGVSGVQKSGKKNQVSLSGGNAVLKTTVTSGKKSSAVSTVGKAEALEKGNEYVTTCTVNKSGIVKATLNEETGEVTVIPLKKGVAKITVKTPAGKKATYSVTVVD